jgi:hypothetical protein
MRDHGSIDPAFWTGATGRKMRKNKDARILAVYLMTSPHATAIGIYYLAIPTILHETGLSEEEFNAAVRWLSSEGVAFYDAERELVWVPRLAHYQLAEAMKPTDKRMPWVRRQLSHFRGHVFHLQFLLSYGVPYGLAEEMAAVERKPEGSSLSREGSTKTLPTRQDPGQEQEQEEGQISPSAPARDPGAADEPTLHTVAVLVPRPPRMVTDPVPGQAITGHQVRAAFGAAFASVVGGKTEWHVVSGSAMWERSEAMARTLQADDIPHVEPTMRKVLLAAADSQDPKDRERHYAFGSWCSRFPDLRDEAMGLRKPPPIRPPSRASPHPATVGQAAADNSRNEDVGDVTGRL